MCEYAESGGGPMTQLDEKIEFDTSDVDRHIGKPVGVVS